MTSASEMTHRPLPPPPPGKSGWPWESFVPALEEESGLASWPRISIVTPSYNQGPFIEETIRSVLLQGYPNLEYIVLDGGSDDETVSILRKYDPWLTYWSSAKDEGQSQAINSGFERATGDVLAWLNSDDTYLPGAMVEVARAFSSAPQAGLICGTCTMVDREGRPIGSKPSQTLTPSHFLCGGSVPGQPAVFFKEEVIRRAGRLNQDLHYLLDWELWLRISLLCSDATCIAIGHVLACTRIWPGTKTSAAGAQAIEERQGVLERVFRDPDLRSRTGELRRNAFGDLWWRWAHCRYEERRYGACLKNALRGLWVEPGVGRRLRRVRSMARLIHRTRRSGNARVPRSHEGS